MKLPGISRWLPLDHYSFVATTLLLVALVLSSWFISRHWLDLRIQSQIQELKLQSTQATDAAVEHLQRDNQHASKIARSLSSLSSLQRFLNNPRYSTALQADLNQFGKAFELEGIWLLDRQGKVLSQSTASPPPPEYDRYTDGKRPLARLIFDPEQQQARIYHANPVTKNGSVTLLICATIAPISLQAYRIELLVTDADRIISLSDNPDRLGYLLAGPATRQPTDTAARHPSLPISISPLVPEVLLLGPRHEPVLLVSHTTESKDYQVHALADAEPIYRLAREKDSLAAIITLASTGSLWGGILTILTLQRNRRHHLAMSRANDELLHLNRQLKQLATTDPLTQCPNRRAAETRLKYELAKLQRYHHPFCIVMLDIDYFKRINDQHGHDIGDQVLRHFAIIGRKTIRDTDVLARIGGEEFLLILPETAFDQGMQLAQRLLDTLAATPLYLTDRTIGFTFSGGMTQAAAEDNISQLLIRADHALYQAKEQGRCRICSAALPQSQSVAVG
ncbi:diguanylate cyclase (GGDEF)-like protein [Oceanisphaera litoralis]|uniref:GGDEF domain-containing protein n=1 Tax=Oceanisphaera litoralis TaxID=225144 RepID=UPI001959A5A0|nr:GGDEF domain-containing protein [Oceanisphaera litoralis]MBM7456430.1 diguanylate cyclase (GGDEF)-like protein [Oceanisphaera litoralis]